MSNPTAQAMLASLEKWQQQGTQGPFDWCWRDNQQHTVREGLLKVTNIYREQSYGVAATRDIHDRRVSEGCYPNGIVCWTHAHETGQSGCTNARKIAASLNALPAMLAAAREMLNIVEELYGPTDTIIGIERTVIAMLLPLYTAAREQGMEAAE